MKIEYNIVNDKESYKAFITDIRTRSLFTFDLETTGLATHSEGIQIVGIGFCYSVGLAYYIPFNGNLDINDILNDLREVFENDTIAKTGHNVKFDARVLDRFGIKVKNIIFDTMVASYCLYGDRIRHNLDDISLHHFNHVKVRTKTLIPKKTKTNPTPSMLQSSIEDVGTYCCEDVDFSFRAYERLTKLLSLEENSAAADIFYKIDMPLVEVLLEMECGGVKIDETKMDALREELSLSLTSLQTDINILAGREITLTNPKDISDLIYTELDLCNKYKINVKKTASGASSTEKDTLKLFATEPIVNKILEYKTLSKLISTYILSIPEFISKYTGLMHPFFSQTRTSTGRLASSEPNCQNIPAKNPIGKKIRGTFVSRWPGGKILASDYSQAELRILAHISKEPVFIKAYNDNIDIHLAVAADIIYDKPKEEVLKEERTAVKTINFGLLYGMRAKKLAATLDIDFKVAEKMMNKYMTKMKGLKNFLDSARESARANGYTETYFGRRRYVSKIFSTNTMDQWAAEREAANHIIQGTNADIIKLAMIEIQAMLFRRNLKSKLILQVHDELVLDVHPDELSFMKDEVIKIMESIVKFDVVMKAEGLYADSWSEAH